MLALGKTGSIITREANRQNRQLLAGLPREQQVELISQHAVQNFLGGVVPAQNLDDR